VDGHERLVGNVSADDVLEVVTEELGSLGRIVGLSQPGIAVPTTKAVRPKRLVPSAEGLQCAASDPEC